MRALGVDHGEKRVGLALSDATGLLARPWMTLEAGASERETAASIASLLEAHRETDTEGLSVIVVGLPRRLSGEHTPATESARRLASALEAATGMFVHLQDERLTSHEAEATLALTERDWKKRKARLDAQAAAIILQDYLDARAAAIAREGS